jgi:hypothetical protein
MTSEKCLAVEITLRIPGAWRSPMEITERLPNVYEIIDRPVQKLCAKTRLLRAR